MAMESSPPEIPFDDAMLQVQLMNLGRIMESPTVLNDFTQEDFSDLEIKWVIKELKSDKTKEAKNFILKTFMRRRGLGDWGEGANGVKKELFDTQRRQAAIETAAIQACCLIENIKCFGEPKDKEIVLAAVDKLKEILQ